MADLPPLTPPDSDSAYWLTDEDHGLIRRSDKVFHAPKGHVKLFDPDHVHLTFGAASTLEEQTGNIQFGEIEPHFAIVRKDHPALDVDDAHSLFRMERRIVVVGDGGKGEEPEAVKAAETPRAPAKPAPASERPHAASGARVAE